jgi:aspartate kinase
MGLTVRIHAFGADVLAQVPGWLAALATATGTAPDPVLAVVDVPPAGRAGLDRALAGAGAGDPDRARSEVQGTLEVLQTLARDLGVEEAYLRTADSPIQRLQEIVLGASLVGHASPRTREGAHAVLGGLAAALFSAALARHGASATVDARLPGAAGGPGWARPTAPWPEPPGPGAIHVLPGGFGLDETGTPRAFGRGGPDLIAVALAAAWGLGEAHIWTLDDGIQTADPSLVPGARHLPRLSYAEAQALSGFGGRALHPEVLARAEASGLTLRVGNLLRPRASTRLTRTAPPREPGSVASVAYKEGLHLLHLPPTEDLEALASADRQLREAGVHRHGAILGPEGTLLVLRAESEPAVRALAAAADGGGELQGGWALVALVGEGLQAAPGGALRLLAPVGLETLGGLLAGSSPISVSFLVPEGRLGDVVPRLHRLHVEAADRPLALAPLSL